MPLDAPGPDEDAGCALVAAPALVELLPLDEGPPPVDAPPPVEPAELDDVPPLVTVNVLVDGSRLEEEVPPVVAPPTLDEPRLDAAVAPLEAAPDEDAGRVLVATPALVELLAPDEATAPPLASWADETVLRLVAAVEVAPADDGAAPLPREVAGPEETRPPLSLPAMARLEGPAPPLLLLLVPPLLPLLLLDDVAGPPVHAERPARTVNRRA